VIVKGESKKDNKVHGKLGAYINTIPEMGFMRLKQILQIIPISKTQWWAGVKEGRFPQSVKLGPRTTCWRVDDIRNLVEQLGAA